MRKSTSILTCSIAGVMAIMTVAGDHVVLTDDGTECYDASDKPAVLLILVVGAGVIGSVTFLFIIVAEVMRRSRRRKYSLIQH